MPTRTQIINSLTMPHVQGVTMNTSGAGRYELTYEFAGDSQPRDVLWDYWGWTAFSSTQKARVRDALDEIETFLNVTFNEVRGSNDPDINFGRASLGSSAGEAGGWNTGAQWDGQVMYDSGMNLSSGWGRHVIVHEIGHALGLDHPFEGDILPVAYDNSHYTVMSYDDDPESGVPNTTMMLYDLLALQTIWGAAANRTGDTSYDGRGDYEVRVIWDTGGTDKLDASARSNDVILDLRAGAFSTFGAYEDVAIAFGVEIEKAVGGSGKDALTGNGQGNEIRGNGGGDTILGLSGKDVLFGDSGRDLVRGGGGDDTIYGGAGNDILVGDGGDDRLWGKGGSDTFRFLNGAQKDVVKDFEDDSDVLEIRGLGTRSQVLDAATQAGGDVAFDFGGGDVLLVKNISLAALIDDLIVG